MNSTIGLGIWLAIVAGIVGAALEQSLSKLDRRLENMESLLARLADHFDPSDDDD